MTKVILIAAAIGLVSSHVIAEDSFFESGGCLIDRESMVELKKRQAELRERERALEEREKDLSSKETALKEEVIRLKELRDELAILETTNNAKLEERTVKLMETMQKMSPKAAAKILSGASNELAISAMSRIPTERLAKMMNSVDSKRATQLAHLMTTNDWKKKAGSTKASSEVNESANQNDEGDQ